jgi:hypothetical protein
MISSLIFLVAAVQSARHASGGFSSYAVAVTIGLVMAACNFWIVRKAGTTVESRTKRYSESRRERCLRALYLGAVFWGVAAAVLGGWTTSAALHLFVQITK